QTVVEAEECCAMGEFVKFEVADSVATIRVDRPKMNALSRAVQEELRAAAKEATERDDVKAVVLYGGERLFAAGADVKEMATMSHAEMVKVSAVLQSAFTAIAEIPKPVVAAVTGYALGGGCELAMCADDRKSTRLNSSHVKISYAVFCLKKKKKKKKRRTRAGKRKTNKQHQSQ